jgi:membrane-bound lytic murein transglycosylase A
MRKPPVLPLAFVAGLLPAWRWPVAAGVGLLLAACAQAPQRPAASPEVAPGPAVAEGPTEPDATVPEPPTGADVITQHAAFKVSAFDSLPGWRQDDVGEAWEAFAASCRALSRKPAWQPLCAQVRQLTTAKAQRAFLEHEFALLTVQNTDRTRVGDITGYYEPLLAGQRSPGGTYSVPVYGVPNDLYTLDLRLVPPAQRKSLSWVRAQGRTLVPAAAGQPGALRIDLRRFNLDTLDRRLRVRLQDGEAAPYYSRAEIAQQARLDAPVLAWVDDPLALYAMQVQGTGRIRLPDGTVLRLQYADQNGQPFRPMRLKAEGGERVQTRGRADGGAPDEVEHFELGGPARADEEDDGDDGPDGSGASVGMDDAQPADGPLTRGGHRVGRADDAGGPDQAAVADAVAALKPAGTGTPQAQATPAAAVRPRAPAAGSQALVDDLLRQAQTRPAGAAKDVRKAQASRTASRTASAPSTKGVTAALVAQRNRALMADPSYIFFRVAGDQTDQQGPVGALGVPLTAGRSLAVDPRVLPLGYPVFLDASGTARQQTSLRRLMFAQDTGGAIRGAVRADYFWGFGAEAGKQARRTRHKGRMWLLVPKVELAALTSSQLVTRGKAGPLPECLLADAEHCESAVADDGSDDQSPAPTPASAAP